MSKSANECIEYLNSIIGECETYDFITRDSDLQREACGSLQKMLDLCAGLKDQAIAHEDEEFANALLGYECSANSLMSTLNMWILLKDQKPDDAWDQLIDAQSAAIYAAKAHKSFTHLEKRMESLEALEKAIFPPQVFVSAGLIVRRQECSICKSEYGECEHLAGKPYWGKFCGIVARGIEANHVAVVKSPADKRCRVTQFTVKDGERNRMTWKINPPEQPTSKPEGNSDEDGLMVQARIIYSGQ